MRVAPRLGWGGRREGAGRPPSGPRSSEPHKQRPAIAIDHAVLVTARLVTALRKLGVSRLRSALARAIDLAFAREDFRIIHLDVRSARLELIVEADDRLALARGMQGFQVSAARSLNRIARRSGSVFPDRYRARILPSRRALAAALTRWPRASRGRLVTPTSALFAGPA
jgi:hypothetical protein